MSEGEFHVHGPHEHEVEHRAQHGDLFAGRIAVMTAIFATIGAFFGYMGGATQNDALLFKNEAAMSRLTDAKTFDEVKAALKDVPGLKVHLDPDMTIEFTPAR